MSKIGRAPITIPPSVTVTLTGNSLSVKGPLGVLTHLLPRGFKADLTEGVIVLTRPSDTKVNKSLHGLHRALIANLVQGVTSGFHKDLELVGTGYRARLEGQTLVLALGFSHEVKYNPPAGVEIKVEGTNLIHISGINKHLVGQAAANVRGYKPPEPYKGKGIRYNQEIVRRKAGKAAKTASA